MIASSSTAGKLKVPSLAEVQMLLGPFSLSSVQMWLRMRQLTYSSGTRGELAKRVFDALQKEQLSPQDLQLGLIGIEESRSKTIVIVQVAEKEGFAQKLDKQLKDLGIAISAESVLGKGLSPTPKMVYATNTSKQFRMKWGEVQTRVIFDRKKLDLVKSAVPIIFVFVIDKITGVGQLRFETPEALHSHLVNGEPKKQAYFDFYREKCENYTGLAFEPIDVRTRLREILLKQPPVVVPVTISTIGEDQQTVIYGSRSGADPRLLKDFKADMKEEAQPRTFERAPVRWQHSLSNYKLYRDLWCTIDALEGTIRFDADCTEAEVEYVISQLV